MDSLNASGRVVAKNALSGYATLLLGALLGFVLTPILVRKLGIDGFGCWSLVLATVGYLGLLEAGIGLATITRVASLESDGPEAVSEVLSSSLALTCGAAGLGMLATVGLSAVFPILFDVPAHLTDDAHIAVLLIGGWQCVAFIAGVHSACLLGTGRMYLVNFSGFAVASLVSIGQGAILLLGGGLAEIAAAQFVGAIATVLVFRFQIRRTLPDLDIRLRRARRPMARRLVALGWRNSISTVAGTFAFGSDIVIVGLLLNPAAAAAYAVALRAYTLLSRIATGVLGAFGPTHAHAAQHSTAHQRFRLYCLTLSLSLFLALLGALTVATYASPLLDLWIGDVPPDAPTILLFLCAVLTLQAPGFCAYLLLLNSERATDLMRITVAAASVNVAASVAFTAIFGAIGPALGSLVAVLVFDAVYLPWRICKLLDQPYAELIRQVFVPLAGPLLVFVALLLAGRLVVADGLLVPIAAGVAAAGFIAAWWVTAAGHEMRGLLRRDHLSLSSAQPGSA